MTLTTIENATVVTVDPARRVIENGVVAFEDDRIVAVGPAKEVHGLAPDTVLDGSGRIVIPGLVDLYSHSGCGLFKCLGEQLPGIGWWPLMDQLLLSYVTPEFWYVDTLIHARGAPSLWLHGDTHTTGALACRASTTWSTSDRRARAAEDIGIRAGVIAGMPRSSPWVGEFADIVYGERKIKTVEPEDVMRNIEALIHDSGGAFSERVSYLVGTFVPGNPTLVDEDHPVNPFANDLPMSYFHSQAERLASLMSDYDIGYWAHAWGDSITHAYDDGFRELLGERSVLSHCTRLDDRSIEILAETGTNVNHCPRARRLQMWHETCRVVEMIDAGVNVGLGSDGPQIDRNVDPFMDMQMVFKAQRRRMSDPLVLPPGTILEMSTINGYQALGLGDIGGSIEVGKKADLVVVDMRKPHLWPVTSPVKQLVYYANGADVEHVFVDGRHLVDQGRIQTIDTQSLFEDADDQIRRIAGLEGSPLQALMDSDAAVWRQSVAEHATLQ